MKRFSLKTIIMYVIATIMYVMPGGALAQDSSKHKTPESVITQPDLSTYYIGLLKSGPQWSEVSTPEHERLQEKHMTFIQGLLRTGKILAGGPYADGGDLRGMVVFRANSLDEARTIFASDPMVQAGHLIATWNTWLVPKDILPDRNYLNKVKTGRSLKFNVTVDMPVSEVFSLWSTSDGAKKFFAPDAKIDPVFGGRYEIIFDPKSDPEGKSSGTYGARIIRYERDQVLAFEWTMPPITAALNTIPLPTWVEVRFEPVNAQMGRTQISLEHYGFGDGENWDKAYKFFQDGWPSVIDELKEYCAVHHK